MNVVGFIGLGRIYRSETPIEIEEVERDSIGIGIATTMATLRNFRCKRCGGTRAYPTLHKKPGETFAFCANNDCLQEDCTIGKEAERRKTLVERYGYIAGPPPEDPSKGEPEWTLKRK